MRFKANTTIARLVSRRALSSLSQPMDAKDELLDIRRQFSRTQGSGSVELERNDSTGVAIIRFRNASKRNAISGQMMSQFWESIEELQRWKKGRAVVVCGADGFFCSGGDLTTVRAIADPVNGRRMSLLMHANLSRLQALPLVSVAVVEGMAIGGGAEISTSCDFRLMGESALMGFVHIRLGIASAWGGGSRLAALIGPQRALQMMLSGRRLDATEALRLGLADDVIPSDVNGVQFAHQWVERLLGYGARETIGAVKGIVNGARYLPLELALREEVEYSASVWGGVAHQEALQQNIKHK